MKFYLSTFLLLACLSVFSQSKNQIIGKWEVCYQREFKKIPTCGYPSPITYDLKSDSTYIDNNDKGIYGPFEGKWKYDGKTLIIDQNDTKMSKSSPMIYKPIWIDKDTFYSIGNEGSKKIAVIFKRK